MRALPALVAVAVLGMSASGSVSQERQGRYMMSPAENGFARLDTETGAMSLCARKDGKWSCDAMDDDAQRMRQQIDRLTSENRELKAEIDRLDKQAGGDDHADRKPQLPSEQDVDKAFDYVEGMIRKFRDRLKDLDQRERRGERL